MKTIVLPLILPFFFVVVAIADESATDWTSRELARFPAVEANQGVAVDGEFFYAIDNRRIGKYRKSDGERVGGWQDVKGGEFIHLNAGYVKDGFLVCAHSNFPGKPMLSSVEWWDVETMRHTSSHSFGIDTGSLVWAARRGDSHYACFAHYAEKGDKDGERIHLPSQVVCFEGRWNRLGAWVFPKELVKKFGTSSASCGAFGPGGYLYVTGHDEPEMYVLDFPKAGSVFRWIATVPVSFQGQAFAWDPSRENVVYGILRKSKTVVVNEITIGKSSEK